MSKAVGGEDLPVIGWREWVGLPELGVSWVKAKVDTGARSSSLHAFDLEIVERRGKAWVTFSVHPLQRSSALTVRARAEILEFRRVRSSSGQTSERPVIVTQVAFGDEVWPIEVTLANRDEMGFRMLLGREACRTRFLVDSGRSFYGAKPPLSYRRAKSRKKTKKKKKKKKKPI
ncbi:MAG: ATP-dependent zinc protease [Planctomycetes bacterium]|nr:ATP-dependent zinc protease [Planctomycetota bacterium]